MNGLFKVASGLFISISLVFLSIGCGSSSTDSSTSSDTTTGTTGAEKLSLMTTLESTPKATAPVYDASEVAAGSVIPDRLFNAASTGDIVAASLPMAPKASDEYGNTFSEYIAAADVGSKVSNKGACEMLNYARGALHQMASGDQLTCMLGQQFSGDDSVIDGQYHIYNLSASVGGETEAYLIKFKADTDADGVINSFEMFACQNGSQTEYLKFDIDSGNNFTMNAKGVVNNPNSSVARVTYEATVTGPVSDTGQFTGKKTLNYRYQNLFTSGTNNHVEADIEQTKTTFLYNGYSCDKDALSDTTCSAQQGSGGYQLFGYSQLVNNNTSKVNYNLNLYALGHGATYYTGQGVTGWDGDTGATDSTATSETYRTYVTDNYQANLKTIDATFNAITYSQSETWDCSGTSEGSPTVSESVINGCFGRLEIDQNVHLECSDLGN